MQNKIVESNKQLAVPTLKKIQNEPDTKALPHQAAPQTNGQKTQKNSEKSTTSTNSGNPEAKSSDDKNNGTKPLQDAAAPQSQATNIATDL